MRFIGTLVTLECKERPSVVLGIKNNEWLAYCFDEACAFILRQIRDGKEPIMRVENNNVVYSKPSDLYNKYKR